MKLTRSAPITQTLAHAVAGGVAGVVALEAGHAGVVAALLLVRRGLHTVGVRLVT